MKKSLSLLLVLTMLVSLFAGLDVPALADDSEPIAGAVSEAAVLTINLQAEGDAAVPIKSYNISELSALAEINDDGVSYIYYKKDAANAVVATQYVTLDAILKDAGMEFGAGDKLAFECADGPYSKGDFSYATMSKRGIDSDGNAVPTAVALAWETGDLTDSTVADIAANAKITGNLRFVSGMTAEEAEAKSAAGNRMPSGVIAITVVGQPVVQPSPQKLKVDGVEKKTEVYNISDFNYFKLRDIAMLLNGTAAQFEVEFDTNTKTVFVTTGKAYTPVGGELTTGTDKSDSCVLSDWKVEVNGEAKDIVAYLLEGNNFFKLADLGQALGFGVAYDPDTNTMLVTSK